MKYYARVSKRVRNVRVYAIVKRLGSRENALTKLFTRVFNPQGSGTGKTGKLS